MKQMTNTEQNTSQTHQVVDVFDFRKFSLVSNKYFIKHRQTELLYKYCTLHRLAYRCMI